MDWSPGQYLKFADERTRAARDLLAQVPNESPRRVIDIGCGPGNSTSLLAERWPAAELLGLDSSESMLSEARSTLPSARFAYADAENWVPDESVEVVFANAIYQWVPHHLDQLPKVLDALPPGGTLAVQMPDNLGEPSHRLMSEVAARPDFAAQLAGTARQPLPAVSAYYDALVPVARRVEIWHTVYNHVMTDARAIVDWVKGTGLRPFLQRLEGAERTAFESQYLAEIDRAYPPQADGKRLLRFPRIFIVATR